MIGKVSGWNAIQDEIPPVGKEVILLFVSKEEHMTAYARIGRFTGDGFVLPDAYTISGSFFSGIRDDIRIVAWRDIPECNISENELLALFSQAKQVIM